MNKREFLKLAGSTVAAATPRHMQSDAIAR